MTEPLNSENFEEQSSDLDFELAEQFWLEQAELLERDQWLGASFARIQIIVDHIEQGDTVAADEILESLESTTRKHWEDYSSVAVLPKEVDEHSYLCHRLLLRGLQGFLGVIDELFEANSESDLDSLLLRAESASRCFSIVEQIPTLPLTNQFLHEHFRIQA